MSGLEDEFPGRIETSNLDATTPESVRVVQSLGFKAHGLVIRSSAGDVLWKQPDHDVRVEDARAKLRELLRTDGP